MSSTMLPKCQHLLLFSAFLLWETSVVAQRTFVKSINGHNRSYLLYSTSPDAYSSINSTLIVMLHPPNKTAREVYLATLGYPRDRSFVLIFPSSKEGWGCGGESLTENRQFIGEMIYDTYDNFHIDRNKIFVLGDSSSACLLQALDESYTSFNLSAHVIRAGSENPYSITRQKDVTSDHKQFPLWADPSASRKMSAIDTLRGYRYHNRWVADFQIGAGTILPSSKTGINDGTYMDLGTAKSFLAFRITKWLSDSVGCFVDLGWLKVPRKMELDGERVNVGGGMILPLTLGGRYAVYRTSFFHPYVALGGGMVFVMATGRRFSRRTLASGVPNLTYGQRYSPQITLSAGLDMRMSKRIVVGTQLRYLHSFKFESLGNLDSIRGFNITGTLGYVINANSLKRSGLK